MAELDFLPFATNTGANVLDQASWAALAARGNGFSSGTASSAQVNKALRQASFIAAAVASFVYQAGINALDDGNLAEMTANLTAAIKAQTPGKLTAIRGFITIGATTYTPTAGAVEAEVIVIGGGGAGGGAPAVSGSNVSAGSGGTGGTVNYGFVTLGGPVVITVGAGGTPAAGAVGGAGGASSFGTLVVAPGGPGGIIGGPVVAPYGIGGLNGNVGTGASAYAGGDGIVGGISFCPSTSTGYGAQGGGSLYSGGGAPIGANVNGIAARGYGGGGGGTAAIIGNGALMGGAGSPGIVIVKEYS